MRTKIIAEAATNHQGNIEVALDMVREAAKAGADYIKFQSWQTMTLDKDNPTYDSMAARELSDKAHSMLIEACRQEGIEFLTTCFDCDRVGYLKSLGMDAIKVASTDVASKRMLRLVRKNFKHVILSTGMAHEREVEEAVEILRSGEFTLMHCVALYPTPDEKANLGRIDWLRQLTNHVGYSDHTVGNDAAKIMIAQGVELVEKHFTLKKAPASDTTPSGRASRMAALPDELRELCEFTHKKTLLWGKGAHGMQDGEQQSRDLFIGRFGDNR